MSLPWRVYFETVLVAEFLHAEDAASFVAFRGDGAQIFANGKIVWSEGQEDQPAGESYDHVADVCFGRAYAA